MKYLLKNTNNGFFYRDKFWLVLPGKKDEMSSGDIEKISQIKFDKIEINKKYKFHFNEREKLLGVGWSHNSGDYGIWSEGNISFILFNLKNTNSETLKIKLNFQPYRSNKNKNFEMNIFFNSLLKESINLKNFKEKENLVFKIKKNELNKENILMFKFNNLISPVEIYGSPDARKLGNLLSSLKIIGD